MFYCAKSYVVVLALLFLASCSRVDLYFAKQEYQKALSNNKPEAIVNALTVLAELAPETYQAKLRKTQSALEQFEKAKAYISENNFYLAFNLAHDSYRAFPTKESKETLLQSGVKIRYLLDSQTSISRSFRSLPKSIDNVIRQYKNKPVTEWDLIELNSLIEQLGASAKDISSTLKLIERKDSAILPPEINAWISALKRQELMINNIQEYIVNLALFESANVLERLNSKLTQDSINLLALVREELAEETMRPNFARAIEEYQPYFDLNENLALASSPFGNNRHALWYKGWHSVEINVLKPKKAFAKYPETFNQRTRQLGRFNKKIIAPDLKQGYTSLSSFITNHQAVYSLVAKLKKDRMLLNYSKPST